jgi:hypothetical protein
MIFIILMAHSSVGVGLSCGNERRQIVGLQDRGPVGNHSRAVIRALSQLSARRRLPGVGDINPQASLSPSLYFLLSRSLRLAIAVVGVEERYEIMALGICWFPTCSALFPSQPRHQLPSASPHRATPLLTMSVNSTCRSCCSWRWRCCRLSRRTIPHLQGSARNSSSESD